MQVPSDQKNMKAGQVSAVQRERLNPVRWHTNFEGKKTHQLLLE